MIPNKELSRHSGGQTRVRFIKRRSALCSAPTAQGEGLLAPLGTAAGFLKALGLCEVGDMESWPSRYLTQLISQESVFDRVFRESRLVSKAQG